MPSQTAYRTRGGSAVKDGTKPKSKDKSENNHSAFSAERSRDYHGRVLGDGQGRTLSRPGPQKPDKPGTASVYLGAPRSGRRLGKIKD